MVFTEFSRFTNDELLRLVANMQVLTPLELELYRRIIELEEHIEEIAEATGQMELPLQ